MVRFKEFTKAQTKEDIVKETKKSLKKSFGIDASEDTIKKVIGIRANTIRKGMEKEVPRIILSGIGSFSIKRGRKAALMKGGKIEDKRGIFKFKFEISHGE
jgi:hypothetical protein